MTASITTLRPLIRVARGQAASDGDGVQLTRIIGTPELNAVDPFLLLDAFGTDRPADYIGGFPPHPHRGFETVTYLLAGRMRHRDNAGHEGVIEPGGIQWMTAGRGIVHSEMPEQDHGELAGFQLWVNLPAAHKMAAPAYREYTAEQIPTENRDGISIRVISGTTAGGITGPVRNVVTEPLYLDVTLEADAPYEEPIADGASVIAYLIRGAASTAAAGERRRTLTAGELGVFGPGDGVSLTAGPDGARLLLIAARRIGEPIARGGPFVMNTRAEVEQAFADYRAGRF
ncbi:MAG: pirin family protein [Chromatiales bacterium]|nr:pirin family protein [Chromatiales bacterium]